MAGMANTDVRRRSDPLTVATRRRPVEVVREQGWSDDPGRCSLASLWWLPRFNGSGVNYARRQQYRRLSRAGAGAAAGGVAVVVAIVLVSAGAASLGCFAVLVALGLGLYSRHWLSLAHRSGVGARSEDEVQRALAPLQAEGWRLRHSLAWQGRGDIDSVAIAPTGIAVAIETNKNLRRAPFGPGARAGGVAFTAPVKVGTQRRPGCHVRGSRHGASSGSSTTLSRYRSTG